MSADNARALLDLVAGYSDDAGRETPDAVRPPRIATVDPAYAGTGAAKVTFDGESVLSVKTYVVMTPVAASDRVAMLAIGRGYVILGKLGGGAWYDALVAADAALGVRVTNLENRAVQGVIPSSVVVGSGSASTALDGTVTFTGASSVALNGVFNGVGADQYRAIITITGVSGTVSFGACRLRLAGTDASAGAYDYGLSNKTDWSTTLAGAGATTQTSFMIFLPGTLTSFVHILSEWLIARPGKAASTHANGKTGGRSSILFGRESYDTHATATAYDGIDLITTGGGTISGTIKIIRVG